MTSASLRKKMELYQKQETRKHNQLNDADALNQCFPTLGIQRIPLVVHLEPIWKK
jgi:hypothetical protein